MKRSQAQPLKDILKAYVKAQGLKRPMIEGNVKSTWLKLMGPSIASKTSNIYIKDSVLYINLNSAVLRNELMLMQDAIISRFNEAVGEDVVERVILR